MISIQRFYSATLGNSNKGCSLQQVFLKWETISNIISCNGFNLYFITVVLTFQKKPKKNDAQFKKPEGMHRELWGLIWSDNK